MDAPATNASDAEPAGARPWQLDVEPATIETPVVDAAPEASAAVVRAGVSSEPPALLRLIEALLFLGGPPLTAERAAELIRGLTPTQFTETIDALNRDYREQARPYHLLHQGAGYVLTLRPRYRFLVEKLHGGVREARLSAAAVDVLAIVAYRQPVAKLDVDTMRGHESGPLLRQLLRRGLIAVAADDPESGYLTTSRFLELFGLSSLDDLPETEELQRL